MKKFLLTALLLLAPAVSRAADLAAMPLKAMAAQPACTISSCSGWYGGFGLSGSGSNVDILGGGINNSVFAAGGIIDVHGGYQFWNGTFFAAVELGIGNEFQHTQPIAALGAHTLVGYEIVKLGMGLQGLFTQPNGTPAPSQGPAPINIPGQIANMLMSPYLVTGAMQRQGVSQWINGAGAEFLLASHWNLDLRYVYGAQVNSGSVLTNIPALNLVTLGLNYHF